MSHPPAPPDSDLPFDQRDGAAPRPGMRVLLAEDHEDSREALRALLEAYGYGVVVARNGAEALAAARACGPDLILMDMMMPVLDGLAATRAIRADPAIPRVPIVAITAMDGVGERVREAGCDDYLVKPIDIRSFIVRVGRWVRPPTPEMA